MEPAIQLCYCFSILCIVFGLYILRMDSNDGLRLVFFLLCVVIAVTSCIASILYSAMDRETLALWERVNFVAVVVCWAVNLNFYILLTERKMRLHHYFMLYAPAIALILADFTVCHIVADYTRSGNRWKYVFSPMYYVYILYSLSYCAADMTLLFLWAKKSRIKKYRLQAKMILCSMIPLWLVCIVVDYVLPHFRFHTLLPIGPLGRMIYILVLWYSFVKYRFMMPKSSILIQNIVLNIEEIVVLIDREARIIFHNQRFDRIIGSRHDRKNKPISDFIKETRDFTDVLDTIIRGKADYGHAALEFRSETDTIPTNAYLSGVLDNYGDLVGILIISRENRDVRQFRDRFKISERQMEIINLIITGLSNAEISGKLGISKKTTETHIFNIYGKLGIDNKIELYNLTAGFHLAPAVNPTRGNDRSGER